MLKSLVVFSRSCAADIGGCLDLSRRWVPVKERVSLGWRRCQGSKARRERARVVTSRRSLADWMPAKTVKLSVRVGRRHPVTMFKASRVA